MVCEMVGVNRSGMISRSMKAIGLMIKPMVEEDFYMVMAMSTKAIGKMIKHMVKESISTRMVRVTLDSGSKIFNMDLVSKNGSTALLTKGKFWIIL